MLLKSSCALITACRLLLILPLGGTCEISHQQNHTYRMALTITFLEHCYFGRSRNLTPELIMSCFVLSHMQCISYSIKPGSSYQASECPRRKRLSRKGTRNLGRWGPRRMRAMDLPVFKHHGIRFPSVVVLKEGRTDGFLATFTKVGGALVRMCHWYLSWGSDSFPPTAL